MWNPRMAVMPDYQFHPQTTFLMDSLQTSFSKFHVRTTLQFLRYSSSNSAKKQFFCANFTPQKNPHKRFINHSPNTNCINSRVISSRSSWLDNWNATLISDKPRKPQPMMNYRNRGDVSSSDSKEGTSTSTGGTTMERIVEKLKKFDYKDDIDDESEGTKGVIEKGSIEDIFHVEE
ncbi:hypothetical protein ABFS83_04G149200 [Erythranthe nasuta]